MVLAAFRYFILVFMLGALLGTVRQVVVAPLLGMDWGLAIEVPVMVLACVATAYHAMSYHRVSDPGQAIAMGALAFIMLIAAEATLALALLGQNLKAWLVANVSYPGWIGLAGQVAFACIPPLLSLTGGLARLHRRRGKHRGPSNAGADESAAPRSTVTSPDDGAAGPGAASGT